MILLPNVEGVILFSLVKGCEKEAIDQIKRMEGVKKVFVVCGEHDGVVVFDVKSLNDLKKIVKMMRTLKVITKTVTYIAMYTINN
ncbi:MAG: Lrp/AsnC ligand binding domain-containing protein [Nitrososphaerales archaeon]